jgi:hypothetical protein
MSTEARIKLTRQALLSELRSITAMRIEVADKGHTFDPKPLTEIHGEELRFVGRYLEDGGVIEVFDFQTARAPGWVWSMTLYKDCQTRLGIMWAPN